MDTNASQSAPFKRRTALVAVTGLGILGMGGCAIITEDDAMTAALNMNESTLYEDKGTVSSGGTTYRVQKDRETGDYSILDRSGRRHSCLGNSSAACQYTAAQLSAAGGGGGGGGGAGGGGGD